MRGQLERLIDATKLASAILQILPLGAGAHPAWWARSASSGSLTKNYPMWSMSST
jgi:hypothetical protein